MLDGPVDAVKPTDFRQRAPAAAAAHIVKHHGSPRVKLLADRGLRVRRRVAIDADEAFLNNDILANILSCSQVTGGGGGGPRRHGIGNVRVLGRARAAAFGREGAWHCVRRGAKASRRACEVDRVVPHNLAEALAAHLEIADTLQLLLRHRQQLCERRLRVVAPLQLDAAAPCAEVWHGRANRVPDRLRGSLRSLSRRETCTRTKHVGCDIMLATHGVWRCSHTRTPLSQVLYGCVHAVDSVEGEGRAFAWGLRGAGGEGAVAAGGARDGVDRCSSYHARLGSVIACGAGPTPSAAWTEATHVLSGADLISRQISSELICS